MRIESESTTVTAALATALSSALALVSACGGGAAPDDASFEDFEGAQTVIEDFADGVVIPTYAELAERLDALDVAVQALAADTSEPNLLAAQDAWVAAREPWEASEGFLFGPVDSLGLDPALDNWPVDRSALDGVLASPDELNVTFVGALDTTLRGFHTAEYLLFDVDRSQTAADIDARELEYLTSVSALLAQAGRDLVDSWTVGVGGETPYAALFKGAGNNAVYPSLTSAGEEIVRGMIGIADEVANGKIADPFDQADPTLVESQFSFNSITDFQNNIHSIQSAYTGDVGFVGVTGAGLDEFVASEDPALDARFKAEIEAAITAIGEIPEPFHASSVDPAAAGAITAAQQAIGVVQATLEQDILPLVL